MRFNYYEAVERLKAVRLESTMSFAYERIGCVLAACTRNTLEILNNYERIYIESKNFKRKFDFELEIRSRLCRIFEAIENGESVREYGDIVAAWVERKNAETAQAEAIADETPAVENEPTLEKISQTADKYLASEMTANEVEAVMKEANVETLREFATQREILIEDDEDHAGLVKIVMEDLVCEKLGVYEEEPNDGETYAEPEETDPLAPVIEEVKKATTANAIVNALMTCTPRDMLKVCTELTGIKHVMGGMLPKKHTAETVATVLMAHRLSLKIESIIEANAGKKDVESELRECPYVMHRWLMRWAGIKLEGEMPREVIVKRLASYYFSK